MVIGILQLDFSIPGSRSLKDKRRAMKSLKERMRGKFNCSVAEVDYKDSWGRSRLAVCVVSDDTAHANTQLNEIARFCAGHHLAFLEHYEIQML